MGARIRAATGASYRRVTVAPASTGAAPATFYLLQEDGASKFTLEDGSGFLLLETAP